MTKPPAAGHAAPADPRAALALGRQQGLALAERLAELQRHCASDDYAAGWTAGWRAAERDLEAAWQKAAGRILTAVRMPTWCQLRHRRGEHPTGPCGRYCDRRNAA